MENRIIPLNAAEGIFYPAFDKYLCKDEQITVEAGEMERLWDCLAIRGKSSFVIRWKGKVMLKAYDRFLCFLSLPVGASITGRAVVDGKMHLLFENTKGGEAPVELTGTFEKSKEGILTDLIFQVESKSSQTVVSLSWLGVSRSDREAEIEALVPVWEKAWDMEIQEGKAGILFNNLILSEEESANLKKQTAEDEKTRQFFRQNAEKAMEIKPEELLREYAPVEPHMYRFVRVRDRGRETPEKKILNLAIAGWLLEDEAYSRQAARLILALLPMKWHEGPVCEMEGSQFHHVCFTEDHLLAEVCLAMGFLGGIFTEAALERIYKKVEVIWLFIRSKCMEPGYRNFMNQGIVGNRGAMIGAAFLQQCWGGYEAYVEESFERHTEILEKYLTEDGHCAEGGNYFEYSFSSSILLWHIYARIHGKKIKGVVPKRFCKSGRYLETLMSSCDREGRLIPVNCGGGKLFSTLLLVFMTMVCDFPEGNNYLIARFAKEEMDGAGASFDYLFYLYYREQIKLHPYMPPMEEMMVHEKSGLLAWRNGSTKLVVTVERNPLTGHFHEDRGGIVLESEGEILLAELGTTGYANPLCLLMGNKNYHNLACPVDLVMAVESETGIHAASEAAFPIKEELRIEDMEIPEARVLYSEKRGEDYAFAVETGMLYGTGISGVRKGTMDRNCLILLDCWSFEEEQPLMVTYVSYQPWFSNRMERHAVSGRLSINVEADGDWDFETEEGMADYAMTPVHILRIRMKASREHIIRSTLQWRKKELCPENTGRENTLILQEALNRGGTIRVEKPGTYEVEDTLVIGSHTHLIFGAGVFVKRAVSSVGSFAFVNRGAFTRTYDTDIIIEGLHLITGGVEARQNAAVYGLTGELSFFYVKHLRITDFVCLDLPRLSFGIHVCTFEDLVIERVHIEGRKDAVHLGKGSKFVIRHGLFRTFDDPIALNAHDYAVANPQMGWIENGLIEDCYDLADQDTTGYFCRILAGAWCDWKEGMEIQNSDTVVSRGRVYRAFQQPDGKKYTSMTPPTHEEGLRTLDGIHWVMVQEEVTYQCGCRNIHFKDIYLQKVRQTALSVHFDHDQYSRSVYPGAKMPVQENLVFEHVVVENLVECLVRSITPVDTIKVVNSVLGTGGIWLESLEEEKEHYMEAQVAFIGNTFTMKGTMELIRCEEGRRCSLTAAGNLTETVDFEALVDKDVTVRKADIPVSTGK